MELSMTDMPEFRLNLRRDAGAEPYILSCSIVGQTTGVHGIVRRLRHSTDVVRSLLDAGISDNRYRDAVAGIDNEPGATKSFDISLNEAQKLSVIHTESTE
ncbi:MAG TPA: hypothetical protein VK638_29045 [Edaphobacter sp.]|nr:hypothetical protein [Edaphobacter sp.]